MLKLVQKSYFPGINKSMVDFNIFYLNTKYKVQKINLYRCFRFSFLSHQNVYTFTVYNVNDFPLTTSKESNYSTTKYLLFLVDFMYSCKSYIHFLFILWFYFLHVYFLYSLTLAPSSNNSVKACFPFT